ncbi:MAG: hypothetical protein LBV80_00565 [Deltaproteobacteria bacterium]|jgi:hypothetical protein|nr:hypothetical protein [Deltaproteobacteria bacterium]
MDEFVVIPRFPAYSVSPLGRVRSERSGILLCHDSMNRVAIRTDNKIVKFHVGELLAEAGFFEVKRETLARAEARASDAEVRVIMLEAEVSNLKATVSKGRKANALLLGIRDKLNAKIASLQADSATGPKRGRKAKNQTSDTDTDGDDFNGWEGEA